MCASSNELIVSIFSMIDTCLSDRCRCCHSTLVNSCVSKIICYLIKYTPPSLSNFILILALQWDLVVGISFILFFGLLEYSCCCFEGFIWCVFLSHEILSTSLLYFYLFFETIFLYQNMLLLYVKGMFWSVILSSEPKILTFITQLCILLH